MATPLRLLKEAGLIRYNLILFALMTAAINGVVTASVGAWLAQTYSSYQNRRSSVQTIADLIYERRMRGGMVVSSLRRGADTEELRHRKGLYDEVFVEWNKKVANNVLQIREVMGARETSKYETLLLDKLVPVFAEMDACLTRGYDLKLSGRDPMPNLEACRYADLHQFTLDCAKSFTDELFRVTRLSFSPFAGENPAAIDRIAAVCTRPEAPAASAPQPAAAASPANADTPAAVSPTPAGLSPPAALTPAPGPTAAQGPK